MAELKTFLEKNVEGYLFNDLRSLIGPNPAPGETDDGVGYPLLMTAFAGIELLGALLSEKAFHKKEGGKYFNNYWTTFLYPEVKGGNIIADALYHLVRNGLAHSYVLKGRIGVGRWRPEHHLKRDSTGLIYVDAVTLAQDLITSYDAHIPVILRATESAVNRDTMAQRLAEIKQSYEDHASLMELSVFPNATVESAAVSCSFTPPPSGYCFEP